MPEFDLLRALPKTKRNIAKRRDGWLHRNATRAAAFVMEEYEAWRGKPAALAR